PQREQVIAESVGEYADQERRHRRLVDVTKRQVAGEHPEVELVAVVAVAGGGDRQQDRRGHGGNGNRTPGVIRAVLIHPADTKASVYAVVDPKSQQPGRGSVRSVRIVDQVLE